MPFLMQLQGPSSGRFRTGHLRFPRRALRGVGDAIVIHPLVFFGGLALGGYLAYRHVKPPSFLSGRRRKRL